MIYSHGSGSKTVKKRLRIRIPPKNPMDPHHCVADIRVRNTQKYSIVEWRFGSLRD